MASFGNTGGENLSTTGSSVMKRFLIIISDDLVEGPDYLKFVKAIQVAMDNVNAGATSNAQKIQKWHLLKRDFSVPGGELGPTLKVKRHVVSSIYGDTIEKLYK